MFTSKLFGYLFLFCVTKCELVFKVSPLFIDVGDTKNLVLICSVTDNSVSGLSNITRLVLSRLDSSTKKEFDPLLSISLNDSNGSQLTEHSDTFSWIVTHGESFIEVNIQNPTAGDATEYTCDVYGSAHLQPQRDKVKVQLLDNNETSIDSDDSIVIKNVSNVSGYREDGKTNVGRNNFTDENNGVHQGENKCVSRDTIQRVLKVSVDPEKLTIGMSSKLQVTCNFTGQYVPDLFRLTSLVISHSPQTDNPKYEHLIIVSLFDGREQKISFDRFLSVINILRNGNAFVKISWNFPTLNRVGLYKCEVNGVDTWGRPMTLSSTAVLSASKNDIDKIYELISKLSSLYDEKFGEIKSEIINIKNDIRQIEQKSNIDKENIKNVEVSLSLHKNDSQRQNIEFAKQHNNFQITFENYSNLTNRLINSKVQEMTDITETIRNEVKSKADIDIEKRFSEKILNLNLVSENTIEKLNLINRSLITAINDIKHNYSQHSTKLQQISTESNANLTTQSGLLKTMITEIKNEQIKHKEKIIHLSSNMTHVQNNVQKTLSQSTQNMYGLQKTLETQQNYLKLNFSSLENLHNTMRDKLNVYFQNTSSHINRISQDVEDINQRTTHPKLLYKNELNKLFISSSCKRYWLSRVSYNVFTVSDAQAMCQRFGGYLAEIDSDYEYNVVSNFIKKNAKLIYVILGGTDSLQEGRWVNRFSQTEMAVFRWGPSEPNNHDNEDCLCLWENYGWIMNDCKCNFSSGGGFLCEIPE